MSAAQHELSLWEIVTKVFYAIFFWGYLDSLPDEVPQHIHFEFIFWAIRMGMSPNAAIPLNNGTSLPLPCYLAHKRQLPLLCRLLRDGAISFSGCDKIWPWVKLSVQEIEPLYELMKYASPSPAFSKWLCANPSLVHPLADMLTYDSTCRPMVINERRRLDSAQWKAAAEAREAEAKAVEAKEKAEKKAMEELVQSLCAKPPAEARAYVEKHTKSPQLIRVAVHHGFLDLIYSFIPRGYRQGYSGSVSIPVPVRVYYPFASTVTFPYRLASDDATNAWMWLIKGEGDLDHKAWAAMVAANLAPEPLSKYHVLAAVLKSHDKVSLKHIDDLAAVFHTAVSQSNAVVAQYLISHLSARVNTRNDQGKTPLLVAAQGSNIDVVRVLLEAKANVNRVDKNKNTALHLATDASVAKLLIKHGASRTAINNHRLTPVQSQAPSSPVLYYLRALDVMEAHVDQGTEGDETCEQGQHPIGDGLQQLLEW
jgi:hypothetical protein